MSRAAALAAVLGAGLLIASPAAAERLWRVQWIDPNPGDQAARMLLVCDVSDCADPLPLLFPRWTVRRDGSKVGLGFWPAGRSPMPIPEVRGRLTGEGVAPSDLSAPVLLERSVLYAEPVPEPSRVLQIVAGSLTLIAFRGFARRRPTPTSSLLRSS